MTITADDPRMRRWIWQYKANRIATAVLIVLILLNTNEVYWAVKYHFPWWDDIALPVTTLAALAARFVQKYTNMYRIDI